MNRTGRGDLPGAEIVAGDATDPAFTTRVCAGADVVYFCLNAAELRQLGRGVPAAAARRPRRRRSRRRPPRRPGQPLRLRPHRRPRPGRDPAGQPDLGQGGHPGGDDRRAAAAPTRPAGSRSPSAGRRTTSVPAPPARRSARPCSAPALTGRTAQVMGDPDQLHSYSYTPDVAAALITLGTQPGATGRCGTCRSPRPAPPAQIIDQVYALAGHRPRSFAAGAPRCGCSAWSSRRCASTCTRSTSSPTAGSSTTAKFRAAFGAHATPLDDALAATLAWYRDAESANRAPASAGAEPVVSRLSERDHTMNTLTDPPARRRGHGQRRHPGHRRLHRPRLGLRLPEDPEVPDGRASWPSSASTTPRSSAWFLVLVLSAALLAPAGVCLGRLRGGRTSGGGSRASASPRRRPGHRPVAVGAARSRHQRRRPRSRRTRRTPTTASSCCTPGSAPSSARPSATP